MSNLLDFDTPLFEKDDLVEDVVIDIDGIGSTSEMDARDMVDNLSKFYYDEEFMRKNPNVKKRIDSELESLRVLIKMRKADEAVHDAIIKAISANNSNASLYRSLAEIQKTILSITSKMNDIVSGLNNMLKGFQLELNFEEKTNDETTEESISNKTTHRGTKEFINQMLNPKEERLFEDEMDEEE